MVLGSRAPTNGMKVRQERATHNMRGQLHVQQGAVSNVIVFHLIGQPNSRNSYYKTWMFLPRFFELRSEIKVLEQYF